jgi:hypothetical protein
MLAMVGNDNAWYLTPRSVLRLIASMLAPTGGAWASIPSDQLYLYETNGVHNARIKRMQ